MAKWRLHHYFLTEECPFNKTRKIKPKAVLSALGVFTSIFVVVTLFLGSTRANTQSTASMSNISPNNANPQSNTTNTSARDSFYYNMPQVASRASRQYTSIQVVRRSDGMAGDKLPMGSTISLKLLNTVISSDSAAPVIALVTEDILWKSSIVIPVGSKAIGQASFDDTAKRLQVRFNTLVFPEGDQHMVSGLGLLPDGSSGLTGDYHSGSLQKQTGRFLGNFVGGLASGMMERKASGLSGAPYEPGGLKNGILNGISQSVNDQTQEISEDMKRVHPYLEVESGASFLLYLEKEFP